VAKRLVDLLLSSAALLVLAPVLALAALGVRIASPGLILFRAERVGRDGRPFTIYKLRTMHVEHGPYTSAVTAADDPRVFPFGAWLRRSKIDELPQLLNILRGEMSIVGPRPEDPRIVAEHYTPLLRETLDIRPGLASPGSIYNYTHGERLIRPDTPEADYVERLLPIKVALDVVYVRHSSPWYDAAIVGRTVWALAASLLGKRAFPDPPEMEEARRLLCAADVPFAHSPAQEPR
jgi:lipopolysaccharide/colanic/teichoic acid biosynthesis glycosyltransferase